MQGLEARPGNIPPSKAPSLASPAPWYRRFLKDLLSIEALFALLCFSGSYKGTEFVSPIQSRFDITLGLVLLCAAAGTASLLMRARNERTKIQGNASKFLGLCLLLLFYITLSYFTYEPGPDATRKLQRV